MGFRLSPLSLKRAINHLCKYGDTDVFPHLPELAFFREESANIVDELKELDLDTYNPAGVIEALAPKSRYSFRMTHQLNAVDNVLFLASVAEIGEYIEALRQPASSINAFSYRFDNDPESYLFLNGHTYKDWLRAQRRFLEHNPQVTLVVATDISDFYARINFHRLENLLDEAAPGHGAVRYIIKTVEAIRAKQSFGLPVGGAAARILAELALVDIDTALVDHGIAATRFVDDFRIFLSAQEHPYDVLSFLAQDLGLNEGLSLNADKTVVYSRSTFSQLLEKLTSDISDQAEDDALESLTAEVYFDDEPDPDDIEALRNINLLGLLKEETTKEDYDVGRIKVIFRALKIVKPIEAIDDIKSDFLDNIVFAKEITLLMESLVNDSPDCFSDLTDDVISAILEPPASSVQLIRTWLLELFSRGIVPITSQRLKKLDALPSILDKRQLHIIRGRLGNKNSFRRNKVNVRQMPYLEQIAFIAGATCLPKDEYTNWLRTVRPVMTVPTSRLFLEWMKANRKDAISKFSSLTIE